MAAALGHGAQKIAAGRFDLDHIGAVVGKRARADGADDHGREVDYAHARERAAIGLGCHCANSSSISPQSTPFLSAAQMLSLPFFCTSPRTSMKSPTHSGW